MFEILLCSFFGLDHKSSFEIIHKEIAGSQFVCYYFYVPSQIYRIT